MIFPILILLSYMVCFADGRFSIREYYDPIKNSKSGLKELNSFSLYEIIIYNLGIKSLISYHNRPNYIKWKWRRFWIIPIVNPKENITRSKNGRIKKRVIGSSITQKDLWKDYDQQIITAILIGFTAGIFFFTGIIVPVFLGAVFTSKANGGWDQAGQTTWNEVGTPGAADTVTISTHDIFLESNTSCTTFTISGAAGSLDTTDGTDWDFTVSGVSDNFGTITCNSSDMSFQSGVSGAYGLSLKAGSVYNGGTGNHIISAINSAFGGNTLTFTTGTTDINGRRNANNVCLAILNTTAFDDADGLVKFTYAGQQELFFTSNRTLYNVEVDKGVGNVLQYDRASTCTLLTIDNNFTVTTGTFTSEEETTGTDVNLTVEGNYTNAGVSNWLGATITLGTGAAASTINNTGTINVGTATIYAANVGFFFIATGNDWNWDSAGGVCNIKWGNYQFNITTGGGGINVTMDGSCQVDAVTASVNDTFTIDGTLTLDTSLSALGTITVTSGAIISGSAANRVCTAAGVWNWDTCTLGNLDIQFAIVTPGGADTFTINNDLTTDAITVTATDIWTYTGANDHTFSATFANAGTVTIFSGMTLQGTIANIPITNTNVWNWDTCDIGNVDIQFAWITGGGADTFTLIDPVTADDIVITALDEIDLNTETLTFSGDWTRNGVFTHGNGAVVLSGVLQTINDDNTWNDFTKSVAAADTLTFENGTTQTFQGTVTLNGAAGQLLLLVSDLPGTAWNFTMQAAAVKGVMTFLNVVDSDASGSAVIHIPIAPTNSTDGGGNTDWFAVIPPVPPIPVPPSGICINRSVGSGVCPNMNYELLIDDVEVTHFESVQITDTISALSGFTIKIGNPEGEKTHRYNLNSRIEFKASWGDQEPQTQIIGFIKQRKFETGRKRIITLQGLDFGDLLLRKRAWDNTPAKNPITFSNERASSILQQLIYFVPEISLQLTRLQNDPRMDWTTDPTTKVILDEVKAVAEYAGYEWAFRGTRLIVRPPKTLEESSATFNLVFGRYDRYAAVLPELPYVWLLNSNVGEDAGAIRNIYTVDGATGIKQTARNDASIQRFQGEFEGYYNDPSITSDQTAQLVARRLTEVNGFPRTNVSVAHRGAPGFNTGDVVGVGDENGGFSMLENEFLRVVNKSQTYGKTWNCATQLGTLKRDLSELL